LEPDDETFAREQRAFLLTETAAAIVAIVLTLALLLLIAGGIYMVFVK
jgi:hypothetical protein